MNHLKAKGDCVIMQKSHTVYVITNKVNGKRYIGQTTATAERRFAVHKSSARTGCGTQLIHKAINEFGEQNFFVMAIETGVGDDEIDSRESYWIQQMNTVYPNGYNIQTGGIRNFTLQKNYYESFNQGKASMSPHGDIVMIDKDTGEEIAIFRCAVYAERFLRRTGKKKANHWPITRCCMGKQKTAYGYKWIFRKDMSA